MIRLMRGNLIQDSADVLVNPVNTVGIMGKGLALQFKRAFPENYDAYRKVCDSGELKTGMIFAAPISGGRWIVNFPTKRHWRSPSKLSYIEDGLDALIAFIDRVPVTSVAIPPLGCGNGGLPWSEVRRLIESKLAGAPVEVRLYEPGTPAPEEMVASTEAPALSRGNRYVLAAVDRYIHQAWDAGTIMNERASLLEVHKTVYFVQRAGLALGYEFEKGHFGPYSPGLNRFLREVEGHFIMGFGDGTGGARSDLYLLPRGVEIAKETGDERQFVRAWDAVSQWILGYEYAGGLELLASVDYLCHEKSGKPPPSALHKELTAWSARKGREFSPHEIGVALKQLASHDLIED